MPIRVVTASAVALRALTMSRDCASMSSNSLNLLSKAWVKPVVWSSLARSVIALVLVARSWTMRSQSPKHWWQGLQSGKVPEKPRAHWSQRTPETPCWHPQWPVTRLHWEDSMPRGSQSHAVGREVTKSIGFWEFWLIANQKWASALEAMMNSVTLALQMIWTPLKVSWYLGTVLLGHPSGSPGSLYRSPLQTQHGTGTDLWTIWICLGLKRG